MEAKLPTTIDTASPQFNAAFAFTMQVKERFADRPEVFQQFLAQLRTSDRVTVEARIVELLEGHDDLIDGFKTVVQPVTMEN